MLREAARLRRGVSTAATKIRKRCAVSPSWELRAKRSVRLIGRSVGAASHCPSSSSSCSRIKRRMMSEPSWTNRRCRRHAGVEVETRSAASARKLVTALWQHGKGGSAFEEEDEEEGEVGWDDAAAKRRSSSDHRGSASVEVLSKLSRRKIKAFKDDGERSWHNGHAHAHGHCFSDVMSNGGTVGGCTPARQGDGNRTIQMQELYNSLTASNELVRVLANVLGPTGGLTPTAASLLAALRSELDAARQLVKQHRRGGGGEDDYERRLRRQLAEEVRAWKCRHREKAAAAARLVASELDGERRSRRRAERVGKKLAEALADTEASLRAATRELELERASRERLEKVCDELARGVGGGGTEAEEEELRREAATALEELEREREMLQVADELREERVRMKLAEARLDFEEKNAVVDRLRQELETFLGTTNERQEETPVHHELVSKDVVEDQQLQQLVLASEFGVDGIDRVVTEKSGQEENAEADADADGDSDGSDIELNMDGNSWSYTNTSRSRETTTAAKNAALSVSDRATECGADVGAFDRRSEATRDAPELEQEWAAADGCSDDGTTTKDMDEDAERYEAIKNLREQMLAGHAFLFLSKGETDADSDRQRHGFTSHFEDGGLW
ncbi:hypothetical protein BDA96_04G163400 [Sorghum bicolor]|uniref:Uncharacterized protein n=2 Tax=Sorghum bicolor TaxID=4558 RepID=A0A194YPV4_SORBI|nr:uncharacterized protein LOC8059575 [Sorghum bicolor]XP_021315522.1 uncharacterized protein LOC8059575 [Sorghum bicolor]XP_021315523.1 uncharacterized protein LOC8059575 [Sorghum bicolor]KAG0533101.1 hypothetical protein BDA96_04G163400 [Sorghum bicolor]KXG30263.1 hypothetical protein SORBI_3004G153800 [Sorghum bicolor]OQU84984.1 hypothetical protein SORBI_3004G153800 [Sorghum bicolor]|eukprot:XP_021315521.1 uncharacterized protein LOC8059575 [Sorghum bicolor]